MSSKRKPTIDFEKLFFRNLQREFVVELLKHHGEFLLRRGGDGGRVLSVNRRGDVLHFKIVDADDGTCRVDGRTFETLDAMIAFYYETGTKMAGKSEVELLTPVLNTISLIEYGRLQFLQELGRGNFGQVWRAMLMPELGQSSTTGEEVAVKILAENRPEKERDEFMAEARLMTALDHENIVQLKGLSFWVQDGEGSPPPKLLIVLEYCNLGSLEKLLEKDMVGRKGKEQSLLDAARGIAYLHEYHIIHRDIASRNCLVHKGGSDKFTVKIADFGLSRLAPNLYALVTKRRLPVYSTPPETLRHRSWTTGSDVWSFGVLMQEVYNGGKNPYEKHYGPTALKQILAELIDGFRVPPPVSMPPDLAQLSLRCLAEVSERPTMKEVLEELTRLIGNIPRIEMTA